MDNLGIWKKDVGRDYTDHNLVIESLTLRAKTFERLLQGIRLGNALEVGCNVGHNMVMLNKMGIKTAGVEPNEYAVKKAKEINNLDIIVGSGDSLPFKDASFDLVFTVAVMIHVSLEDLPNFIDELYRTSNRYILIIEYCTWLFERGKTFRGHKDLLMRRNFKGRILKRHPDLKCIREGTFGKGSGFDGLNYVLFEKKI